MDRTESTPNSTFRQAWAGAILTALLLAGVGCSTFSRAKASHDRVVMARQLTQRGVQAMHREEWQKAADLLADAKQKSPYDFQCRQHYAETLWTLGKQEEAIAELQETISLAADDPVLHTRLGRMYFDLGNPTEAHLQANKAIEVAPKHAEAWTLLGDLSRLRGDWNGAKQSYIRAANCGEMIDQSVQLRLASTYRQLGQPQQSLACISLLQQTEMGQEVPMEVGLEQALAYRDLNRPKAAADRFEKLAEQQPLSAEVYMVWAECELAAGRLARAEYAANSALQIDPNFEAAHQLVARLPAYRDQLQQSWRR